MGKKLKKSRKRIDELKKGLLSSYPDFRINVVGKDIIVEGSFPVFVDGKILDRYLIRIVLTNGYSRFLPSVYETGGRIPKIRDRHFFPKTDEACVYLKDEWGWISSRYPTLIDFIKGPVNDFFIWQACYDYYGEDRLGGWEHGGKGRLEFYQQKLKTTDVEMIKLCLLHLSKEKYKPNLGCFCGSGKKVYQCHKALIIALRSRIPPSVAKSAYYDISKISNNK